MTAPRDTRSSGGERAPGTRGSRVLIGVGCAAIVVGAGVTLWISLREPPARARGPAPPAPPSAGVASPDGRHVVAEQAAARAPLRGSDGGLPATGSRAPGDARPGVPPAADRPTRDETNDALSARGWRVLDEGDFAEARALARECLGRDPGDVHCHRILTQSFTRKGEYGRELDQALDDCLALLPDEAQCMEGKILAELRAKNVAAAKKWLEKREALSDQPPDFIGRALIAEAEGDGAAACEAYRGACRFSQPYACSVVEQRCAGKGEGR